MSTLPQRSADLGTATETGRSNHPQANESSSSFCRLPVELIHQIYGLFTWHVTDRSATAKHRKELLNSRLVCKYIHNITTPLVFNAVIIRPQWRHKTLEVPGLLSLRRERPQLLKHVRHIHIHGAQRSPTPTDKRDRAVFGMPMDEDIWNLSPTEGLEAQTEQVNLLANELISEILIEAVQGIPTLPNNVDVRIDSQSPKSILSDLLGHDSQLSQAIALDNLSKSEPILGCDAILSKQRIRDLATNQSVVAQLRLMRLRLHALAYVLLSIPPTPLIHLTITTMPPDLASDDLQSTFLMHLALTIIRLSASKTLTHLGTILPEFQLAWAYPDVTPGPWAGTSLSALRLKLHRHVLSLSTLTSLTLPLLHDLTQGIAQSVLHRTMMEELLPACKRLNTLIIRTTQTAADDLLWFLSQLPDLQTLIFRHIVLYPSANEAHYGLPIARNRREANFVPWFSLLWHLRRVAPKLNISLQHLHHDRRMVELPAPALAWLIRETNPGLDAVWKKRVADEGGESAVERRQRLERDFVGLMDLWRAVEKPTGDETRQAIWGRLVDDAMSRRW